jgi:hypothetical protein
MFNFRRSGANGAVAVSVRQRISRAIGVLMVVICGIVAVPVLSPIAVGRGEPEPKNPINPRLVSCGGAAGPCWAWTTCNCCDTRGLWGTECPDQETTCLNEIVQDDPHGIDVQAQSGYGPIAWFIVGTAHCVYKEAVCAGDVLICDVSDEQKIGWCDDIEEPGPSVPQDCPS